MGADVIREEVSQFLQHWPQLSARLSSSTLQTDGEALVKCAVEYRHPVLDTFLMERPSGQQQTAQNFVKFLCGEESDAAQAFDPVLKVLDIAKSSKRREVKRWATTYGTFRPCKDKDIIGNIKVYTIGSIKVHASKTCLVIFAVDARTGAEVCLKFMAFEDQWDREIKMRKLSDGSDLSPAHVVPLAEFFVLDEDGRLQSAADKRLQGESLWTHLITMPQARRDLSDLLSHDRVAGYDLVAVVQISRQVADHLKYFHEDCGRLHGDLKARNIVLITGEDDIEMWVLIDLDASCELDSYAGQKVTSSANFPPEMARYELEKLSAEEMGVAVPKEVVPKATRAFEIYYFGLLLFQLCTPDAETVFRANQADNLVNDQDDLKQLAYHMEEIKLDLVARIMQCDGDEWSVAADLALWCLQPCANRRPQSIADVLDHPLYNSSGKLHYLDHTNETFSAAIARWSTELHYAIESNDLDVVRRLFHKGCVHYNLCLLDDRLTDAQRSISPLHRVARYGLLDILQILFDEIQPQALAAVLDARTV